jgi:NAD(P)-dependent dehydrogenase (short-subunit alcohol dehydrogenase family)
LKNIFSIKNKIILVTGAGKGIGFHLAKEMANHEAFVYCIDLNFPKKIPQKLKNNFFQTKCDITDTSIFENVCKTIFQKHKKIDVLVNCAGISFAVQKKHDIYPKEKWDQTINVNLTAAFTCSQSVFKYMKRKKTGSIINITSINAELGFPRNPSYVASKGGLKMLSKSLAKDWGPMGIRVNNLGPGYIKTDMTIKRYQNKVTRKQRESRTLLGRWGEIDDLVGPCIFLASDASGYMTGTDIYVDGGWIANGLSE